MTYRVLSSNILRVAEAIAQQFQRLLSYVIESVVRKRIAERVTQIPGHRLKDQTCLKLSALEVISRFPFWLLGNGIKNHAVFLQQIEASSRC